MLLTELKKGVLATITKIDADKELKHRLNSFGFIKGAKVKVVRKSIGRSTLEVEIGGSYIALRNIEAKKIEVEAHE